jgi:hypothetical protein
MVNGPDDVYTERKRRIEKVAGSPAGSYPCGSRRGLVAFSMQPINEGVIAKRAESVAAWSSLSTN